jgi:hypothetical protein
MNTIGAIGHERQPETRSARPAAPRSDRDNDRHGEGNKDRDSDRADHPPDAGAASTPGTADPPRKLNLTV